MKKFISVSVILLALLSLCSCGKFVCDICGEEKVGKYEKDEILGQEIYYCKDCYEDLENIASGLEGIFGSK